MTDEKFKMDELELFHWGVKGMRWGVRRYQNKDGTLTKAGQKRYNKEMEKLKAEEKILKNKQRTQAKLGKLDSKKQELEELRKAVGDDKKSDKTKTDTDANKPVKKKLKDMSDEELSAKLERFKNEAKYREATTSDGKKFVQEVLKASGKNIATQVTTYALGTAANKFIGELFDDPNMVNPKKGQKDK